MLINFLQIELTCACEFISINCVFFAVSLQTYIHDNRNDFIIHINWWACFRVYFWNKFTQLEEQLKANSHTCYEKIFQLYQHDNFV